MGERIAVARKRAKLTQAQLAEQLGVSRPTMIAVEKGERRPSDEELVKIARLLTVEVSDLVRPHAVLGEVSARFRVSAKAQGPVVEQAVEQVRGLGAQYAELESLLGIKRSVAPLEAVNAFRQAGGADTVPDLAGVEAASLVRRTLSLGDGPLLALDDKLELEAGFRVFFLALDSKVAALFLWGDDLGACVGLNARHPHERQRFSLAHELGHFLRDRELGDVLPVAKPKFRDPAEVFCDAFARELLMPAEGLRRRFSELRRFRNSPPTVADLIALGHSYEVSFQAMALRLEEVGLLKRGAYEGFQARGFKPRAAEQELGYGEARPRSEQLPKRYVQLAFEAFDAALISEGELAAFLHCDRMLARDLYSRRRQAEDDEGRTIELDLAEKLATGALKNP
jgi:Zn-dependent peptidase ImmA (M78 family)/transcriptional regulator with XRE-family HTH domain